MLTTSPHYVLQKKKRQRDNNKNNEKGIEPTVERAPLSLLLLAETNPFMTGLSRSGATHKHI